MELRIVNAQSIVQERFAKRHRGYGLRRLGKIEESRQNRSVNLRVVSDRIPWL